MMIHRCELIRRLVGAGGLLRPMKITSALSRSNGQSRVLLLQDDNYFVWLCHPGSTSVNHLFTMKLNKMFNLK